MKIKSSAGHMIEIPRHLQKDVKMHMQSGNHDAITQIAEYCMGGNKYSFGSFVKGVGDVARNVGAFTADNTLSVFGASNVADNNNWYSDSGFGKTATDVSKVTNKISAVAGQVAATALAGPAGGLAMSALQKGVGSIDTPSKHVLENQNGWDKAGDIAGNVAQTASSFYNPGNAAMGAGNIAGGAQGGFGMMNQMGNFAAYGGRVKRRSYGPDTYPTYNPSGMTEGAITQRNGMEFGDGGVENLNGGIGITQDNGSILYQGQTHEGPNEGIDIDKNSKVETGEHKLKGEINPETGEEGPPYILSARLPMIGYKTKSISKSYKEQTKIGNTGDTAISSRNLPNKIEDYMKKTDKDYKMYNEVTKQHQKQTAQYAVQKEMQSAQKRMQKVYAKYGGQLSPYYKQITGAFANGGYYSEGGEKMKLTNKQVIEAANQNKGWTTPEENYSHELTYNNGDWLEGLSEPDRKRVLSMMRWEKSRNALYPLTPINTPAGKISDLLPQFFNLEKPYKKANGGMYESEPTYRNGGNMRYITNQDQYATGGEYELPEQNIYGDRIGNQNFSRTSRSSYLNPQSNMNLRTSMNNPNIAASPYAGVPMNNAGDYYNQDNSNYSPYESNQDDYTQPEWNSSYKAPYSGVPLQSAQSPAGQYGVLQSGATDPTSMNRYANSSVYTSGLQYNNNPRVSQDTSNAARTAMNNSGASNSNSTGSGYGWQALAGLPALAGDIADWASKPERANYSKVNFNPKYLKKDFSPINDSFNQGYAALKDSGVGSSQGIRSLASKRMTAAGTYSAGIDNENANIYNTIKGREAEYNNEIDNKEKDYYAASKAKQREARNRALKTASNIAYSAINNSIYNKQLG